MKKKKEKKGKKKNWKKNFKKMKKNVLKQINSPKSNLGCKSSSDLRGVAAMAVNGDMATDFISLRMSLTSGLSLLLNCAVAIDDKLFWKLNLEEEEDEDEEEEEE